MCIVSMVHDHYGPRFPSPDRILWPSPVSPFVPPVDIHPAPATAPLTLISAEEVAELRKLIAEFREAVAAAARLDVLTRQPDCVDPEKAKLEARVAELERRLDAMTAAGRRPEPTP